MGKVIVLNFPENLYWGTGSKYHNEVNKFVIGGISPDTVAGKERYTVTNYDKLENFISLQKQHEDVNYPDFVDLIKQLLNDEVRLLTNHKFKRGTNKYFGLDLYIKLSIDQLDASVPLDIIASIDEEGQTYTWREWVNVNKKGVYSYETPFHKYVHYSAQLTPSESEYKGLLNSIGGDISADDYDVLSPNEFSTFKTEYEEALAEFPVLTDVQLTDSVISVEVLNPTEGNTYKYNLNGGAFNRTADYSASAGEYIVQVKEMETGDLSAPVVITVV